MVVFAPGNDDLQRHVTELESSRATLSERLQHAELASQDANAKFSVQSESLKQAEAEKIARDAELIQLRTQVAVQADLLGTLKLALSPPDTGVSRDEKSGT